MVSRKRAAIAALASAALALPAVALAGNAGAQQTMNGFYTQKVLSRKYVAPLQFAVGKSQIFVADSATSTLTVLESGRVLAHGGKPSASGDGGDLAGVGINGPAGEIGYTWTNGSAHKLTKFELRRYGKTVYSINLAAYEGKLNPDSKTHYGVTNPSACVRKALAPLGPVSYYGQKDSHPYSTTYAGNGTWAVADAGGNDVILINPAKHAISAVVLPRQGFTITKALASGFHLPSCVVGKVYYTEPVPTDVESGPNGNLYVSTLPGGPEAPGIPPRGAVWTISPSGTVTQIGGGFADATNIAVRPNGYVYVAQLGAGNVVRLVNGKPGPVVYKHAGAVAVEWANNHLYVANAPAVTGGKAPGTIVRLGYK